VEENYRTKVHKVENHHGIYQEPKEKYKNYLNPMEGSSLGISHDWESFGLESEK
jgi:hypothetical protein